VLLLSGKYAYTELSTLASIVMYLGEESVVFQKFVDSKAYVFGDLSQ